MYYQTIQWNENIQWNVFYYRKVNFENKENGWENCFLAILTSEPSLYKLESYCFF